MQRYDGTSIRCAKLREKDENTDLKMAVPATGSHGVIDDGQHCPKSSSIVHESPARRQ